MELPKRTNLLTIITTLATITIMVGAAEYLGEKEIIFPEIAALAIGSLITPHRAWTVSNGRMIGLITLCSLLGVGIVSWLPVLPLPFQMILAYTICQVIYIYSGTSFAPMISSMVLPVLLQTTGMVYPIAAAGLTALIILLRELLIRSGIKVWDEFHPLPGPGREEWTGLLIRSLIAAALIAVSLQINWRFCTAPPLLVAFTEFTKEGSAGRKHPARAIVLISLCALTGSVSRYLLAVSLGLPLTLAAATASIVMLVILFRADMFLPPAGAMTILAMLIPEEMVSIYPVQVLAGITVLTWGAAWLYPHLKR